MKVKVTVGWLAQRMDQVVEYHRLKMTYGSRVEKLGMFTTIEVPIEGASDYWMLMCETSPWNSMRGVFSAIGYGDHSHEVELSCAAYAMIVTATKDLQGE